MLNNSTPRAPSARACSGLPCRAGPRADHRRRPHGPARRTADRLSCTRTTAGTSTGRARSSGPTATSARITTQTNTWFANYGLIERVNVIAPVPYVWTRASQGVLHGIKGIQDLTLAAKFNAFEQKWAERGRRARSRSLSGGFPLTDYNPELLPLSIGTAQQARLVARHAELPSPTRAGSSTAPPRRRRARRSRSTVRTTSPTTSS